MSGTDRLIDEADQATAAGDLAGAEALLVKASESESSNDVELWLKLAAVQRAVGRLVAALESIHRALALSPLDFTALLMRASILDRQDEASAAVAWAQAIAQRPTGDLPPHLQSVVRLGEERVQQWTEQRANGMRASMLAFEQSATVEERYRIERFRTNVLRQTRHYHSEPTDFHFPSLAEREFHPRSAFPWLETLEQATDTIMSELQEVMSAERAEFVPYVQYADHMPLEQWKPLNHNANWTAIHLFKNGETIEANARHCPRTIELLSDFDQPRITGASPNAMFSLLAPNTSIPPHVGVSNARLVCHLPLIVPDGCWFRVGAETRFWKPGEAFIFDDTIEHEAQNPTGQLRVVFIFDVWHPDLSPAERGAITALMEADGARPRASL